MALLPMLQRREAHLGHLRLVLHLAGWRVLEMHVMRDHLLESVLRVREELLLHLGELILLGNHALLIDRTLPVLLELTARVRCVRFFSKHISFQLNEFNFNFA